MPHKIGIYYEESTDGINDIMTSYKMEEMEKAIMLQKKSEIEAAFLQCFGIPGAFKFSVVRSDPSKIWNGSHRYGSRVIYRIIPDNSIDKGRTYAILKAHPGWIEQFIK